MVQPLYLLARRATQPGKRLESGDEKTECKGDQKDEKEDPAAQPLIKEPTQAPKQMARMQP